MRDTLQLIRKDDNDALFRTNAVGAGKAVFSKLAWSEPIVQPNDVRKVNRYKSIASNSVIPVSFRMRRCETFTLPQATSTVWRLGVSAAPEKPRWVLIGLQTDKSGNSRLLGRYGTDVAGDFVKTAQNAIIAVYKFSLTIKPTMALPTTLEYNGYTMEVKYDDDVRQCRYCGRYGHLIGKCRTKVADDELHQKRRADQAQQMTTNWKEERLAVLAIQMMEKKKLHVQIREQLTVTSDVYNATLLAMEEDDGDQAKLDLATVYKSEQEELMEHYRDTVAYHSAEIDDKLHAIEAKYRKAGAKTLPMSYSSDEPSATTPNRSRTNSECASVDMEEVQHAENRLTNRLREDDHEQKDVSDVPALPTVPETATPAVADRPPPTQPVISSVPQTHKCQYLPPKQQAQHSHPLQTTPSIYLQLTLPVQIRRPSENAYPTHHLHHSDPPRQHKDEAWVRVHQPYGNGGMHCRPGYTSKMFTRLAISCRTNVVAWTIRPLSPWKTRHEWKMCISILEWNDGVQCIEYMRR